MQHEQDRGTGICFSPAGRWQAGKRLHRQERVVSKRKIGTCPVMSQPHPVPPDEYIPRQELYPWCFTLVQEQMFPEWSNMFVCHF